MPSPLIYYRLLILRIVALRAGRHTQADKTKTDFIVPEPIYDDEPKGYLSVSINGINGIIDSNG
mgnify:CR=1 FL=1